MTLRRRPPVGRRRPRLLVGNTDDHASGIRCDIDACAVWFGSDIGPLGREANQPKRIRPLGVSTGIAVAVVDEVAGLEGIARASPAVMAASVAVVGGAWGDGAAGVGRGADSGPDGGAADGIGRSAAWVGPDSMSSLLMFSHIRLANRRPP